jgi:hypothetical protein
MNTVTYDQRGEGWEPYDEQQDAERLPRRPRRQLFNKRSAALAAVIACAAGFYAGVRIEKGQLSTSSAGGGFSFAGLTAARGAAGAAGTAGAAAGTGASRSGAASGAGGAGARTASGFPGAALAGGALGRAGSGSFGTIASVNGRSLYVTDSSGNTVKVKLSSATKVTKSLGVARSSLHPGDAVVIRGLKNSGGTLIATSVSDSGTVAGATGAAGSGGSANGSSSSAVGSLFSGGGAGGG